MANVNISSLNIKITASSSQLSTQLQQAATQVSAFQKQVSKGNSAAGEAIANFNKILLRSIALYGAFKALNLAKDSLFDSVRLAANAETAALSFEVLLGSAKDAKKMLEDINKFVRTTPFRLEDVTRSARSLTAYGFEARKVIPTLRSLGDVAAGTGNDLFDLVEVYGRTRVEGRLYTKDLNQFTSRGIPLLEELAAQFAPLGTNVEDFTAQVRKMAEEGKLSFDDVETAFANMTKEGGRFANLTDRMSGTSSGQFSNLLDRLDELKRSFGEGLLPVLTDIVSEMEAFIKAGDDAKSTMQSLRDLGEDVGNIIRIIGGSFYYTQYAMNRSIVGYLRIFEVLGRLAGTDDAQNAAKIAADDLERRVKSIGETAERMFDLDRRMVDAIAASAGNAEQSLANVTATVESNVQRARNQIKLMTEDSVKFGDKLRSELKTPLEEFEEQVRLLIQADILGVLKGNEFELGLAREVERLDQATQNLRNTLNSSPTPFRDSVAEISTVIRTLQGVGGRLGGQNTDKIVADLRDKIQAEIDAINAQTTETTALTDATKSLEEAIRELLAANPTFGARWSIGPDGKPVLSAVDTAPISGLNEKYPMTDGPLESRSIMQGIRDWVNGLLATPREAVDFIQRDIRGLPPRKPPEPGPSYAIPSAEYPTPPSPQMRVPTMEDAVAAARAYENSGSEQEKDARDILEEIIGARVDNRPIEVPVIPTVAPKELSALEQQLKEVQEFQSAFNIASPELDADYALSKFRERRNQMLESGQTIDAEAEGLRDALIETIRKQYESGGAIGTPPTTAPGQPNPGAEKVTDEINKNASIDRAILRRIATAVEKNARQDKITVKEYAA